MGFQECVVQNDITQPTILGRQYQTCIIPGLIDDMIFAIGGFNGVTTIFHVECYDDKTNEWYEATDMNIYRSALSACVIMGLPNVRDYIHKHRERLMEEKRQKLLALHQDPRP
uniref:Kelch-like protein 10 n=1 Tax=Strigamia maritima TaxID=126957 RepID=T1IS98_STRMM